MGSRSIRYRDLTTLDDYRAVVGLEKRVWGYTDAEDVVPVPILAVNVKRGGILIGAFDSDETMVGFVYSLPGLRHGQPVQWSHMLGVLEAFRGDGVGYRLKLEQRRRALQMRIDLIEWTFDPLQAVNAHLNLTKLGAIVGVYEENIYGESSSPLHRGTPTDRFVAEWWVQTPHVERRLGEASPPAARAVLGADAQLVNRTRRGRWIACEGADLTLTGPRLAVEIPMGFGAMQVDEPHLARDWRRVTREIFTTYLSRGYRILDFELDGEAGVGRYLLTRAS